MVTRSSCETCPTAERYKNATTHGDRPPTGLVCSAAHTRDETGLAYAAHQSNKLTGRVKTSVWLGEPRRFLAWGAGGSGPRVSPCRQARAGCRRSAAQTASLQKITKGKGMQGPVQRIGARQSKP